MNNLKSILKVVAVVFFLGQLVAPGVALGAEDEAISVVEDNSLVCMVNDRYMGSEQIPVEVDGKTYYGCCAGCAKRIQKNAGIRQSTDPVSGATVDKATAVIGRLSYGKVFYFENEETFNEYSGKLTE